MSTVYTAGFARLDITPHLGAPISGGWKMRTGSGLLDPLYVCAIAFGDGEKTCVVLSLDNLGMGGDQGLSFPKEVAALVGIPEECLILCCTHSHTTPSVALDADYRSWLLRRCRDAAQLAMNDRKPITDVQWAEGDAGGVAFVRRFWMTDGTVLTNPPKAEPEKIVGPACENDDSLRVIRILREDAPEICVVNFQAHPDSIGGDWYSADYPGALRTTVEALCPNSRCIFLNGAEGQMITSNALAPRVPASHQRAVATGEKLGRRVAELMPQTVSTGMLGLSFGRKTAHMRTKRDPNMLQEAQRRLKLHEEGKDLEIHPSQKIANYLLAEARRQVMLNTEQLDEILAEVSAVTFCGLALVGIPGEPFNEVGKIIRKNSKFPATCVMCMANGSLGYMPMTADHNQGAYEDRATPFAPGSAEHLADTASQLVKEL